MALYDLAAKLNMGDKYFAQCIRDAVEGKDEQLGAWHQSWAWERRL